MKNCYIWAKEQIANHGGKMLLAWSDNWFGHFHIVYQDINGKLYGYGPDDRSYVSFWRFIINWEWTFQGHTEEYDTFIGFWEELKIRLDKITRI